MKRSTVAALGTGVLSGYLGIRVYNRARGRSCPISASGARIVILGAGVAGLSAASRIARSLGGGARISLVDQRNYHLFTPMLYQVAVCAVLPYDVAIPLRSFTTAHNIEFRKAIVIGIDFPTQQITTDAGPIPYDYLIVALGSTTNFFGNRLAEEHATPLKSLEDGIAVRNRVIDTLEEASRVTDPDKRRMLLTFVIVGGGATGVETAGAMGQVVKHIVPKNYPAINPEDCRVVLIESEPKLLGHMSGKMAEIALRDLRQAGVEVWLNAPVTSVSGEEVVTEDERRVKAGTVLWTTGVRAPDVVSKLAVIHGHAGSIAVNEYLQLPTYPNVFVAGDNASIQDRAPVPLLAASAIQEGTGAAINLVRLLRGEPLVSFRYRHLGNVISLGHGSGVAEIGGRVIAGFAGWLVWRVVHIARLTNLRNKVTTALDWSTAWFYDVDTARFETGDRSKTAA